MERLPILRVSIRYLTFSGTQMQSSHTSYRVFANKLIYRFFHSFLYSLKLINGKLYAGKFADVVRLATIGLI